MTTPSLFSYVDQGDVAGIQAIASHSSQELLNEALIRAISGSKPYIVVETLLCEGASSNAVDDSGRTAMFIAVKRGDCNIQYVKKLLHYGCDVNRGKANGSCPLHVVAKGGQPKLCRKLLQAEADVNIQNWAGNTPLIIACRHNKYKTAKLLLEHGAKVTRRNKLGHFPLHYAALNSNMDLVGCLLHHGADVNGRTYLGISPLMLALERNHNDVAQLLIEAGSALNKPEKLYGGTALHWAVASDTSGNQSARNDKEKSAGIVGMMLQHGANINHQDFSGRTPTVQAVVSNKPEALDTLICHQLLHCVKDTSLSFPGTLHLACNLGHIKCVKILLAYGMEPDTQDIFGDTPVMLAKKSGHQEVLRELQLHLHLAHCRKHGKWQPLLKKTEREDQDPFEDLLVGLEQLSFTKWKKIPEGNLLKTYSPIKMGIIDELKKKDQVRLVAFNKFSFSTWLDNGPEAFGLKVVSEEFADFLEKSVKNPMSLRELCRGTLRKYLGYRASDKVECLDLPRSLRDYVQMKELKDLDNKEVHIECDLSSLSNITCGT